MNILIRQLKESDLAAADRAFRLAFGTRNGLSDPMTFSGDKDYVRTRWRADPAAALGAEIDGELVGSNFAAYWGTVASFGPLSVLPAFWNLGVANRLLAATTELFDKWGIMLSGLSTNAQNTKQLALYQKHGFWPRFLTAIMSVSPNRTDPVSGTTLYSGVPDDDRAKLLKECRGVTESIFDGLAIDREISSVITQELGDTVLLWKGKRLVGFAVCHIGPGTEAGSGVCYVKFGAARTGPTAGEDFNRLLNACESLALSRGMSRLVVGVNTARHRAYRQLFERGFRTEELDVTMHRPDGAGYDRPDVFLLDDRR